MLLGSPTLQHVCVSICKPFHRGLINNYMINLYYSFGSGPSRMHYMLSQFARLACIRASCLVQEDEQ